MDRELMPARPLAVMPGGRIEADERLVRELGLEASPTRLADLAANGRGIAATNTGALHSSSGINTYAAGISLRTGAGNPNAVAEEMIRTSRVLAD